MKPISNKSMNSEHKKYIKQRYKAAIQNVEYRPYWQWVTVVDGNSCTVCKELNGKVFMWNDPIWMDHLPPLHITCRCMFQALNERDFSTEGLTLSLGSDFYGLIDSLKRKPSPAQPVDLHLLSQSVS